MDYQQTLDYLYQRLPMFHRIGKAAYKADLGNTLALCQHLDNPQHHFRSIHIAGTNGKGSTSHLLAAILQVAGYKTGLYTSPHLKSFTERIRINGQEIGQEEVVRFVSANQAAIETIQPSFFELTVGMAFEHFARQHVDIAIIEVGLGGRLDSTNIIQPQLSVITNISFDHQDILGHTLPQIAAEKAGIIKYHTPVVLSEFQSETFSVFEQKANEESAPLFVASQAFRVVDKGFRDVYRVVDVFKANEVYLSDLVCQLTGDYQLKNILGVLQAIELLKVQGYSIPQEAIRRGFAEVTTLTGLKGRWQVLKQQPLVICDTAHNEGGIRHIITQLLNLPAQHLHLVLGTVNDKDLNHILPLFPQQATYYFCAAQIPRALPATDLQSKAAAYGLYGQVIPDVNDAIKTALTQAGPSDVVFIGGSTFVVAEIEDL